MFPRLGFAPVLERKKVGNKSHNRFKAEAIGLPKKVYGLRYESA